MNSYDYPRKFEMDALLKSFFIEANKTPHRFSKRSVYNKLCFYDLKPSEVIFENGKIVDSKSIEDIIEPGKTQNNKEYFDVEITDLDYKLKVLQNTGASNEEIEQLEKDIKFHKKRIFDINPDFFKSFKVYISSLDRNHDGYIKLYIPLDYEHLLRGKNELFYFLGKEGIVHNSKISNSMRVDNVIIRVDKNDTESAKKIIDFIKNNQYISSGLNRCNPFIPTINGIGYMVEHGNSYNSDISYYILEFIKMCVSKNKEASADNFRIFLEYCKNNQIVFGNNKFDPTLFTIFEEAYTGEKQLRLNQDNYETKSEMSRNQKMALFIDSLKITFAKYGIEQVKCAIREIINNGNYSYISNGDKLLMRNKLKDNVSKEEVKSFVDEVVLNNETRGKGHTDINDRIGMFCELQFMDTLPLMLDEICSVTLEKYGEEWLQKAINEFIYYGHIQSFSRYRKGDNTINYRENMRYFDRTTFYNVLMKSISLKGVDVTRVSANNILGLYTSVLSSSKYASVNETPMALN